MDKQKTNPDVFKNSNELLKQHPEFFRFLKEKGVYSEWIKNRCDHMINYHAELYSVSGTKESNFLSSYLTSFVWKKTLEGYDFWENMSIKWHYFVRKGEISI